MRTMKRQFAGLVSTCSGRLKHFILWRPFFSSRPTFLGLSVALALLVAGLTGVEEVNSGSGISQRPDLTPGISFQSVPHRSVGAPPLLEPPDAKDDDVSTDEDTGITIVAIDLG